MYKVQIVLVDGGVFHLLATAIEATPEFTRFSNGIEEVCIKTERIEYYTTKIVHHGEKA